MAGVTGLEPAASGVTGRRSNRLSYTPEPGLGPGERPLGKGGDEACQAAFERLGQKFCAALRMRSFGRSQSRLRARFRVTREQEIKG